MIAVALQNGSLLKLIPNAQSEVYGFHTIFGLISERAAQERQQARVVRKLSSKDSDSGRWLFRFLVGPGFQIKSLHDCELVQTKAAENKVELKTKNHGSFFLSAAQAAAAPSVDLGRLGSFGNAEDLNETKTVKILAAIAAALLLVFLFIPKIPTTDETIPEILQQVTVQVKPKIQKQVSVPETFNAIPQDPDKKFKIQKDLQVKRAVQQDLGFLGLLGKKDLNKALGGAPTKLANASPGAGAGGTQGSGGEVLVGIGQGLKRVTVGNSGVAGLGGIGTKGRGGGQGGYGNASVGSGEGKALSSIPISEDMILEGGLTKAAIQATIAKYLNQVRACYEQGLLKNPGLSGTVTMEFEINGGGTLNFSHVKTSTLGNPEVGTCVSARMMTWIFPKPLGGVKVYVKSYPFLLRPVGT